MAAKKPIAKPMAKKMSSGKSPAKPTARKPRTSAKKQDLNFTGASPTLWRAQYMQQTGKNPVPKRVEVAGALGMALVPAAKPIQGAVKAKKAATLAKKAKSPEEVIKAARTMTNRAANSTRHPSGYYQDKRTGAVYDAGMKVVKPGRKTLVAKEAAKNLGKNIKNSPAARDIKAKKVSTEARIINRRRSRTRPVTRIEVEGDIRNPYATLKSMERVYETKRGTVYDSNMKKIETPMGRAVKRNTAKIKHTIKEKKKENALTFKSDRVGGYIDRAKLQDLPVKEFNKYHRSGQYRKDELAAMRGTAAAAAGSESIKRSQKSKVMRPANSTNLINATVQKKTPSKRVVKKK